MARRLGWLIGVAGALSVSGLAVWILTQGSLGEGLPLPAELSTGPALEDRSVPASKASLSEPSPPERRVQGATLAGRVVDTHGNPVAGACVGSDRGGTTQSDTGGHFRLEGLAAGEHQLVATASGWLSAPLAPIRLETGESVDGLLLVMKAERHVSGRVRSAQGVPVVGASIKGSLRRLTELAGAPAATLAACAPPATRSDADGLFELGPLVAGEVELSVEQPGFLGFARLYPTDARNLEIRLHPTACVFGRLLDPSQGGPVAIERALLLVPDQRGRHAAQAVANAALPPAAMGEFRIPVFTQRPVCVVLFGQGYAPAVSDPVRIEPGREQGPLHLVARRGVVVPGQVRDEAGSPSCGATVSILEEPGAGSLVQAGPALVLASIQTDAAGRFSTPPLAPGRYVARVTKEGSPEQRRSFELGPAGAPAPLEIGLPRGAALRGRIHSREGGALPELRVAAAPTIPGQPPPEVVPVREGRFGWPYLAPGSYRLGLVEPGALLADSQGKNVELKLGEIGEVVLDLRALGRASVRGAVTWHGKPLSLAEIRLGRSFSGGAVCTSDHRGRFAFAGVGKGPWILSAKTLPAGVVVAYRRIEVGESGDLEVDLTVVSGGLLGTVLDADSRQPVEAARIEVDAAEGGRLAETTTDARGEFSLPCVPADKVMVTVGHEGRGVLGRTLVEVEEGRATLVPTIELRRAGVVVLPVRPADGRVLAGVFEVEIRGAGQPPRYQRLPARDRIEIADLEPGMVEITLRHSETGALARMQARVVAGRRQTAAEVVLERPQ